MSRIALVLRMLLYGVTGEKGNTTMKHVYIAHPLGKGPERKDNLKWAACWAAWAAEQGMMPACSWIVLAGMWDETPENRDRGLKIDFEQITRCDELWVCGDHVSNGMNLEIAHAAWCNIPIIDKRMFCDAARGLL